MNSFSVRAIETDAVLFPVGEKSKEKIVKAEESNRETAVAEKSANKSKIRFTRLRRSIKKRGLGIL